MHDDQLLISPDQVALLIADQCPDLAGLDIVPVGGGTVHAIFRVGASVAARFPLRRGDPAAATTRLRREASAAAEFASASPVPAPEPLSIGCPGHGYPMPWSTQTWLPGSTASPFSCATSASVAQQVADLIAHLRAWPTRGRRFAGTGRGGRLHDHDGWVDGSIARSGHLVDIAAMRALWQQLRNLPREDSDLMCHGDLIPSNILASSDRVTGVIDTGGFRAADPAIDLVAGWHLFADEARDRLRTALGCSELQMGARCGVGLRAGHRRLLVLRALEPNDGRHGADHARSPRPVVQVTPRTPPVPMSEPGGPRQRGRTMFRKLKDRAAAMKTISELLTSAEEVAHRRGADRPGAEHLVSAALQFPDGTAVRALERIGRTAADFEAALIAQEADALEHVGVHVDDDRITAALPPPGDSKGIYRSEPSAQELFRAAGDDARRDGGTLVGAHVLRAAASLEHGPTARALHRMGVDRRELEQAASAAIVEHRAR